MRHATACHSRFRHALRRHRHADRRCDPLGWKIATLLLLTFVVSGAVAIRAGAADQATPETIAKIEASFQTFLTQYRREIKRRNHAYLKRVHPSLPAEMYDFFLDVTIRMMTYSDEKGIAPQVECREYKVCKATYTQADGSWAAQQFIFHDGTWRWLDQ